MNQRGYLLVFEGSDGSGKATQSRLLAEYCERHRIPYEYVDFPNYEDFFGSMCKQMLYGAYGDVSTISPYLASLPYALDRWKAKERIQNALFKKKIVIANRYVPSNAVYQSVKIPEREREVFLDWVMRLEYEEFGIPREDLVLYLHVPVAVSQQLMQGKEKDEHEKNIALLEATEEMYKILYNRYQHWIYLECVADHDILRKDDIHARVLSALRVKGILS